MNVIYLRLRTLIRSVILNALSVFNSPKPYVYILNGHMIDKNHNNRTDGEHFARQLELLHKSCDFINIEVAIKMIQKNTPVKKCTIAFTFDDGWKDCHTNIAPQLEKYGINAIFFINPNLVNAVDNNDVEYINHFTRDITMSPGKNPMSWSDIKDLQNRGFVIGSHTLDHYCINDDNIPELNHQIIGSKQMIEDKLKVPCDYFAFPYGNLKHANNDSIQIASNTYKYIFSQSDYIHYYSFNGKVMNRRHFEPFWPAKHVLFFLSHKRK